MQSHSWWVRNSDPVHLPGVHVLLQQDLNPGFPLKSSEHVCQMLRAGLSASSQPAGNVDKVGDRELQRQWGP